MLEGPYAGATLRFRIDFPDTHPERLPIVSFLTDVFHPLVTPLTTYTHTTRDSGTATVSAAEEELLPPGGLSLRHGFPEWYEDSTGNIAGSSDHDWRPADRGMIRVRDASGVQTLQTSRKPHVVEVLQYLRVVFDTEAVIDAIPLEAAANSGAWHAWRSFRSKTVSGRLSPAKPFSVEPSETSSDRSESPRRQPGGARQPSEWTWQGVWQDRVRKSIQASNAEPALFGADAAELL